MSAHKDKKRGTWMTYTRYKNWKGEKLIHQKRGFKTKHEALEYEAEFLRTAEKDMNMTFEQFVTLYVQDMKHSIRPHTWKTKMNMINRFLIPAFGKKSISKITSLDIIQWQNELATVRDSEGKGYAPTYMRSIQNQLHAIFAHAETYYLLQSNPCRKVKKIGSSTNKEMLFWTEDEYFMFRNAISEDPIYYYAFEILYWCGIREGELLALTMEDFDLDKKTLRINKSYQRLDMEDVITDPKTIRSNRIIALPDFLCEEMEDYFVSLGNSNKKARIFPASKGKLHHLMDRYSKVAGVKRIRIHDLRHSCVAMLINQGVSSYVIANRLGHENIHITERYAHLFPSMQIEMAKKLDEVQSQKSNVIYGGKTDEAV